MARTKKCSRCEKNKPLVDFPARNGAADGRRGQCKSCYYRQRKRGEGIYGGGRLPIGPFRDWLNERLEHYGSLEVLAQATGVDPRQIRRCLHESQKVSLDLLDKALISEGSTPLWALPYTEEEFQKAAKECAKTERKKKRKAAA